MEERIKNTRACSIEIRTEGGIIDERNIPLGGLRLNIYGTTPPASRINISLSMPDGETEEAESVTATGVFGETVHSDDAKGFVKAVQAAVEAAPTAEAATLARMIHGVLATIVDDDTLIGSLPEWSVPGVSREGDLLRALVLLYSGNIEAADDVLCGMDLTGDLDAIYLKARCCEEMECRDVVKRLYGHMLRIYLSADSSGRQDPMYNKFLFRMALRGDAVCECETTGIIRDLYISTGREDFLMMLRRILLGDTSISKIPDTDDLSGKFLDRMISEEMIGQYMRTAAVLDSTQIHSFKEYLKDLKLPYPWGSKQDGKQLGEEDSQKSQQIDKLKSE